VDGPLLQWWTGLANPSSATACIISPIPNPSRGGIRPSSNNTIQIPPTSPELNTAITQCILKSPSTLISPTPLSKRNPLAEMTSLLKIHLVQYRCSCGVWYPLAHLHFCRKCAQLKCLMCLNEEIDIIFCPFCLENANSASDAQQRKFRCQQCNQCPVCGEFF